MYVECWWVMWLMSWYFVSLCKSASCQCEKMQYIWHVEKKRYCYIELCQFDWDLSVKWHSSFVDYQMPLQSDMHGVWSSTFWDSTAIRIIFPRNALARILVPSAISLFTLVLLGAYNLTTTPRRVARLSLILHNSPTMMLPCWICIANIEYAGWSFDYLRITQTCFIVISMPQTIYF